MMHSQAASHQNSLGSMAASGVGNGAIATFNNQSMVLMELRLDDSNFVKLHDNRMYCFSKNERDIETTAVELSNAGSRPAYSPSTDDSARSLRAASGQPLLPSTGQDANRTPEELAELIMLRMQTTPKYRVLNALYFTFRLADNCLFLTIVVLSIQNRGRLTIPTSQDMAIFSGVGVELFYDVMTYTTKFWFLERLSIYVGLGIYCLYFAIVFAIHAPNYVEIVLSIRFAAFVLEEMLDIAIDLEMHNDWVCICQPEEWPHPDSMCYTDVRRGLLDLSTRPTPNFYRGSKSAWLPRSAFAVETYVREYVDTWKFRWMYVFPFVCLLPLIVPLSMLVGVPFAVFLLVEQCTKCKLRDSALWMELTHF